MRRIYKLIFAISILLYCHPIFIYALNSIAIAPFKNNNQVAEILIRKISDFKNLEIISQNEVLDKMKLVKINNDELTDPLKILDLGRILNTNFIVFGAYNEVGDTIKIFTQTIDVYNGAVKQTYHLTGQKNEFEKVVNRLAYILFNSENYSKPDKPLVRLNVQNLNKIQMNRDNSLVPDITFDNAGVNELTFKNFISLRTNFIPFFWLDNDIEVIGSIPDTNGENIAILNTNSGDIKIIQGTFSPYIIKTISMSPDKRMIAYESNGDIFVLNIDGTNRMKLDFGVNPSWSPDSKKIAYIKGVTPTVYYNNVDDSSEAIELSKGNIAAWFQGGKEIAVNYDFEAELPRLTSVIVDSKVTHDIEGVEALNYCFLFSTNSYGGKRLPMFSKRNWMLKQTKANELAVIDFMNNEIEIMKEKGKPYNIDAEHFAWSKNGIRLIFVPKSEKNVITVAEFSLKEKTFLKLNIGAKDGISEGDEIDLILIEPRTSPKNKDIYRYQEKKIGKVRITRIFSRSSIATISSFEVRVWNDKVVKYLLPNNTEVEGCIIYYDDDIASFLDRGRNNAAIMFKTANEFFDSGNFNKAQEILKKIIDVYPETQYNKNAKDMMKILPIKRIADE
ncbi:PD40 domain-containing protein [Candidatus Poribacteria bacterium]|nr:PD40 domain-containing protein [Candidatus Poribacteria bacterium]